MDQEIENRLMNRLLAITLLLIATNAILTLIAQPSSFWTHPQTAIRFDGLPIHSSTNPMFDFFLGRGWAAYLGGVALYGSLVWLLATVLPKGLAVAVEFTVLFGLCYCGSNWIVVRWNTGTGGAVVYCAAVAVLLAAAVVPSIDDRDSTGLRRLCWVMALTTTIDAVFTLVGQPASYWLNRATVHEGNPIARYFLEIGWWAYVAYIVVWAAVPWLFALRASRFTGWTIALGMALGGLFGGSNWLFYEWRLGLQAPLIYGMVISLLVVRFVLKRQEGALSSAHSANISQEPAINGTDEVNSRRALDCC